MSHHLGTLRRFAALALSCLAFGSLMLVMGCSASIGGVGADDPNADEDATAASASSSSDEGEAFAVLYDDGSLVFQRTEPEEGAAGVSEVWSGFEDAQARESYPWRDRAFEVTSVRFADEVAPASLAHWFDGMANCTSIDLQGLDASGATSMRETFTGCSSLEQIDLTPLDTSAVTDFYKTFSECSQLKSVNASGLDTSSAESLSCMFFMCRSLEELDASSFDTSNVTTLSQMFYSCESLRGLDLTSFDTSLVKYMGAMFYDCTQLAELDLSSFDTTNAVGALWSTGKGLNAMFFDCRSLREVKLGVGFDFAGNGASSCSLPRPDPAFIPGATGMWQNQDGVQFTAEEIPSGVAATYTAVVA